MPTQPTLPTFAPRNDRVYRFDPNLAPVVTQVPDADHLGTCKAAVELIMRTHNALLQIETKAEILERRLRDPELADQVSDDDPRREAAWDRLKAYRSQIQTANTMIKDAVNDVDAYGRYIATADLRWLGTHLEWSAIERIHQIEPAAPFMPSWKEIAANTVPF